MKKAFLTLTLALGIVKATSVYGQTLSFSQTSVEATYGYAFEAPTLTTQPAELSGITYTSSNNDVAVIDDNGQVTITGPGTATITATCGSSQASYTINAHTNLEGIFALVAFYDGKYHALSTEVTSANPKGIEVNVINGRVIISTMTPYNYNEIAWKIAKEGDEYKITNGNFYLSSPSDNSNIRLNTTKNLWSYKEKYNYICKNDNNGNTIRFIQLSKTVANSFENLGKGYGKEGAVAHPMLIDFEVPISSVGYSTFYIDYPTKVPEGMTAYTITEENNNYLTRTKIEDIIPAKTGVLLKAEEGTYTMAAQYANSYQDVSNNLLKGSVTEGTTTGGNLYYKLTYGSTDGYTDKFGFYWGEDAGAAFTMPAFKAYLALTNSNVKGLTIEDLESGICITKEKLSEVQTYDLFGRKVNKTSKGIYIKNGKKVLF